MGETRQDLQMGGGEHKDQERCRQQHLTDDSWHLVTSHLPPPTIELWRKWIKMLPTGNRSQMHAEVWTHDFCGYVIAATLRVSSYVAMIARFIARSLTQSKHDYGSPLKPISFMIQGGWGWSASQRYIGKTACFRLEKGSPGVTFPVMPKSFRSPIRCPEIIKSTPQRRNCIQTLFSCSRSKMNMKFKSRSSSRAACRLVTGWMIYKWAGKKM